MPRLNFSPDTIAREIDTVRDRLTRRLSAPRDLRKARPGATPREAVWRCEGVSLLRYATPEQTARTPLLIVYALVNRPEMADLETGRSLVETLIEHGFEVYLLDWGHRGQADAHLGMEDFALRYIDGAVDFLRKHHDRAQMPLLGICQGGTFSVCYAALNPGKVEHLVTTVTPIDFHTSGDLLSNIVRHIDIDRVFAGIGVVQGDLLNALFLSLKPNQLLCGKYLGLLDILDDAAALRTFVRMEKWIFDSPALPGAVAREFAQKFYLDNALVKDALEIGGRAVRLENLTMPVTNIFAAQDHLVPPDASRALGHCLRGRDYDEYELPGGHIGLYVSARARDQVASRVAERIIGDRF